MHRLQQSLPVVFVRSLLFFVLAGVALVPFLVVWPFKRGALHSVRMLADQYLSVLRFLLRVVCGIDYCLQGLEHLPDGPVLIASQHESTWETLFFHTLFEHPVMYAKKSIFSYPVFGSVARALGHIPVEPGADAMRDGFRAGVMAVKNGRRLVIFPSGTRRKQNSEPQAGVGVLYQLAQVPVVPVRLTSGDVWPRGTWLKYPGMIEVQIGPPIKPGLDRRDFMQILSAYLAD